MMEVKIATTQKVSDKRIGVNHAEADSIENNNAETNTIDAPSTESKKSMVANPSMKYTKHCRQRHSHTGLSEYN